MRECSTRLLIFMEREFLSFPSLYFSCNVSAVGFFFSQKKRKKALMGNG